jgi:hypothetical protein
VIQRARRREHATGRHSKFTAIHNNIEGGPQPFVAQQLDGMHVNDI